MFSAKSMRGLRIASWATGLCGAGLLLLLVHTIWLGQPSALVVALGKPKVCLAAAVLSILVSTVCGSTASWKKAVGRLALLGISLFIASLAGEVAVRTWLRQTQGFNSLERLKQGNDETPIYRKSFNPLAAIVRLSSNRKLVYELKPNIRMDFGHHWLETNRDGMRESRDYPETAATNVLRIVGIGDSGMFGWNVDQGRDYLSVLETNLSARIQPRTCEVLNLAVPGYNTQQEVELLKERGLKYRPDIVIVGWAINDFDPPFFVTRYKAYNELNRTYLYSLLFYRNEFVKEVASPEIQKGSELNTELVDPAVLEGVGESGARKSLVELVALGRQHGFRVLVFGPLNEDIKPICSDIGLAVYNTWQYVKSRNYPNDYNLHAMHPSEGGHAVLAQYLADFLLSEGWVGSASSR